MMGRALAVMVALVVAVLVLYVPSQHGPEYFGALMRAEHEGNVRVWGAATADAILRHTLETTQAVRTRQPAAAPTPEPDTQMLHTLGRSLTAALDSRYWRAMAALLLLVDYRAGCLLAGLPCLVLFAFAALLDGAVTRVVRARQFIAHDPEYFMFALLGALAIAGAGVVLMLVPVTLPPLLLPGLPLPVALLLGRAIANYRL